MFAQFANEYLIILCLIMCSILQVQEQQGGDDSILCHKEVKGQKMNKGIEDEPFTPHYVVVTELGIASLPELLLAVTCPGCCWPPLRLVSCCLLLLLVRHLFSMYFFWQNKMFPFMLNVLAVKEACMYRRWKFVSLNKSYVFFSCCGKVANG
jgi:hypothetical protein